MALSTVARVFVCTYTLTRPLFVLCCDVMCCARCGFSGAQAALRRELRSGLGSLPSPQHQYELDIPELPPDEEEDSGLPEDAADAKARRQRELEAARAAAEKLKSKVSMRWGGQTVNVDQGPASSTWLERSSSLPCN
jgi:hypothetical protein